MLRPNPAALLALAAVLSAVAAAQEVPKFEVKVLVLNFDPIVLPKAKTRLHEAGRWQEPRKLAEQYIADVAEASRGMIGHKIVEWRDLDEFPVKKDGFVYTADEYLRCRAANKGWHQPDGADYPKLIAKHGIPALIDSGAVDEVWWFGPPYAGFWEASMAGPGAYFINGGVYDAKEVPTKKAFAVMGFNYERGVAEMLHDLAHRTESTMAKVYGGWKAEKLDTDWARFSAVAKLSGGAAGAGNCHFPPNAESDYDYGNKRFVASDADDWLAFPKLTGRKTQVNRETWGGPDYHRNYMKWWFARLPHAPGIHPQSGKLNNWWDYVYDFNAKVIAPQNGRAKPGR